MVLNNNFKETDYEKKFLYFNFFIFYIFNIKRKSLKNEAELQKFRNKVDKVIKEELKNDYKKEYLKRKDNLKKLKIVEQLVLKMKILYFNLKIIHLLLLQKN